MQINEELIKQITNAVLSQMTQTGTPPLHLRLRLHLFLKFLLLSEKNASTKLKPPTQIIPVPKRAQIRKKLLSVSALRSRKKSQRPSAASLLTTYSEM